jgi:hypothetical protein
VTGIDLTAWMRMLPLDGELARAEPQRLCYRLLQVVITQTIPFLRWCMDQQLMRRVFIKRIRAENPAPISQSIRLKMIRDLLTGEDYPLFARVVSLLVLLYAQPLTRIVQLRVDDIPREEDGVSIRLGAPPSPVPEPFASLLLRLLRERPDMSMATNGASPWLLPGRLAGRPLNAVTVGRRIISAGVPNVHTHARPLCGR